MATHNVIFAFDVQNITSLSRCSSFLWFSIWLELKKQSWIDKSKCCAIMLLNTIFIHQSLRATIHIHLFPIFNHNGRDCSNFLLIWQFHDMCWWEEGVKNYSIDLALWVDQGTCISLVDCFCCPVLPPEAYSPQRS